MTSFFTHAAGSDERTNHSEARITFEELSDHSQLSVRTWSMARRLL